MNPNAEALYTDIGQEIYDLIPEPFETAWARVEMTDDVWSTSIFYSRQDGSFRYLNEDQDRLADLFQALRQCYRENGEQVWSTATFKLSSEGRMNLELGYDDVSDFGEAAARRQRWIAKYLGQEPRIDWA